MSQVPNRPVPPRRPPQVKTNVPLNQKVPPQRPASLPRLPSRTTSSLSTFGPDLSQALPIITDEQSDHRTHALRVSMSPSAPSLSRALEVVAEGGSFECFKKGSGKLHAHVALHKDERLLVCTISDASSPKLIPLEKIREIRSGPLCLHYTKSRSMRSFSVIYGPAYKEIGLVARTDEECCTWVVALVGVSKALKNPFLNWTSIWSHRAWFGYRRKHDSMKGSALNEFMSNLFDCEQNLAYKVDRLPKNRITTGQELHQVITNSLARVTERSLFMSLATQFQGNMIIPVETFVVWARSEQGEVHTEEEACSILAHFGYRRALTFEGFIDYLHSDVASVLDPAYMREKHDMTQPLSHYFHDSSHNTYLLGDQMQSQSSIEAYIRALRGGSRCIELDTWDGPEGFPEIFHGFNGMTMTSKVAFEDVCNVIREYAFEVSPYPVVLSIENHCSDYQQGHMAAIMKRHFGDMLSVPPVDPNKEHLLSPEELQYKILVKAKKLETNDRQITSTDSQLGDDMYDMETLREVRQHLKEDEGRTDSEIDNMIKQGMQKDTIKVTVAPELSNLVTYIEPCPLTTLADKASNGKYWEMCSLVEGKAKRLAKAEPKDFVRYNKRQISRIYPAGIRADSSNYDPVTMWACGCQMVALNVQTRDRSMQYNSALFCGNQQAGYILKPLCLRTNEYDFDPNEPGMRGKGEVFEVTILSGELLPRPDGLMSLVKKGAMGGLLKKLRNRIVQQEGEGALFIKVSVRGTPRDNIERESTPREPVLNPSWNETFSFQVNAPELAFVRFEVHAVGMGCIGQFTIRYSSMRIGYRVVYLEDAHGFRLLPASLLVRINRKSLTRQNASNTFQRMQTMPMLPVPTSMASHPQATPSIYPNMGPMSGFSSAPTSPLPYAVSPGPYSSAYAPPYSPAYNAPYSPPQLGPPPMGFVYPSQAPPPYSYAQTPHRQ